MSLNSRKKWMYVQPEEINSWPCLFFSHVQWTSREKLSTKSVSMAFCHIEFLSTFPRQPSMNCSRSFHPAVVNAQIQTREAAASSPHPLQAAVTRSFTHTQPVYLHSQRWNEAAGREIVPLHVFGSAQTRLELWQLFRHMLACGSSGLRGKRLAREETPTPTFHELVLIKLLMGLLRGVEPAACMRTFTGKAGKRGNLTFAQVYSSKTETSSFRHKISDPQQDSQDLHMVSVVFQ